MWETIPAQRNVLVVLHNSTTLDRMLDVLAVFENDFRVQLMATSDLSDPFAENLPAQLAQLGLPTIPWEQARAGRFDLIISASHHGAIDELTGPLLILGHGAGFGKLAPGSRSVFGMSPEWLLRDGKPFAAALGFAHDDDIERLGRDVPAALPATALVGDPTFDRLRVMPQSSGQGVVVTSTWGPRSLLAIRPDLPRTLLDAGYQVRLIVHPNAWAWHGEYQMRTWLAGCLQDGMELVPPIEKWRQALAGADCVIGDHGSVTAYGAALGKPTILAAFPDQDVAPGSPAHLLGRLAPRLDPAVAAHVDKVIADHDPLRYAPLADLITSVPGQSAARLRELCYRLMNLEDLCSAFA